MTRCIIIPADSHRPLTRTELVSLDDLQRVIGGWVEQVTISETLVLLVDEDGRAKRLPGNRRATLLWRLLFPAARSEPGIVGDALLTGFPTEEHFGDVPDDFDRLLIDTHRYVVRAVAGDDEVRSTPFDSFWSASEVAIVADVTEALGEVQVIAYE
jgi:hypothetical protein